MFNRLYKTIKSATGIYIVLIGLLVPLVVSRIEWINKKMVELGWVQDGGDSMILGAPSWAWAIIVFIGYFCFWFLRYAHILRTQIEEARKDIAILREKGVKIRNDGIEKFIDDRSFEVWKEEVFAWNERTKEALKKVSEADSIWFGTLDIVPIQPRLLIDMSQLPEKHAKQLREHDRRLALLGEMIRDQWGLRRNA